jgi:TatD DNase family protein
LSEAIAASLVDFHCHLDLYPDHTEILAECERTHTFTLSVTTTPRAWQRNNELASKTKYVRAALGLHPQLVAERSDEISIWQDHLPESRYVGEVGLDAGPRFYRSLDLQKRVFERVLRSCADAGDKILTLHSVRAASAVIDMLEAHLLPAKGKAVLHWFTGTLAEARRACDLGCYFSINGEMLKKENHRRLVTSLPRDRILTETDGPFTQVHHRPARPCDVTNTVRSLGALMSVDEVEIAEIIQANLKVLVS